MGRFIDLIGTSLTKFQLGIGGPNVKNNSGIVEARNAADSAYVGLASLLFKTYGDDFELNSGSTSSGASWKMTLRRPSSGMTHDLIFLFPSADPSPGQALTVTSLVGNVVTLQYSSVATGNDKLVVDTTSLAFGTASPLTLFTLPLGAIISYIEIVIDTAFTGAPSLSIGITGTTAKYMPATAVDLTAASGTIFQYTQGLIGPGTTEALIATYAAGGAGAGAARILIYYANPS